MAASDPGPIEIRWGRVVAVALVVALAAELASQVFLYAWAGERFRSLSFYRWSPYGLVRNNPDLSSPDFKISDDGFRNVRRFSKNKPPGTLRVLMMGGSTLYSGIGGPAVLESEGRVDSGSTIAQYLERDLRADPALAGLEVEVINAAVNFNRVPEVTTAYLGEWIYWEPDVVVVCGSANNVWSGVPGSQEILERRHMFQGPHPWAEEFERTVNERSLRSAFESVVRVAETHLASVALLRKISTVSIDRVWRRTLASRLAAPAAGDAPAEAGEQEVALYFRDYAAYSDAMVAAAKRHGQAIAFFWEYFLGNLEGIKPLSDAEASIYPAVARPESGRAYNFAFRDLLRASLTAQEVPLVDPLEELKRHDGTVFIDYLHYTRSGNEFMAGVIHDQLRELFHTRAHALRASDRAPAPGS